MADPERQLARAEEYVARLNSLEAAADRNMASVLEASMQRVMRDLRRAYNRNLGATGAEAAVRLQSLFEIAQDFLPPEDLRAWQERFTETLTAATRLGAESAAGLYAIGTQTAVAAAAGLPFGGASQQSINAAVRVASAFLEGESVRFQNQIVQIAGEGIARGLNSRQMERQIRAALIGSGDPQGKTQRMGLLRRAQIIARTEVSNAYGQGQIDFTKGQGLGYVRSVATEDERTCPQCMARHGQIFRVDQVPPSWHPMCRCTLGAVADEDVEEEDEEERDFFLDNEFWRESRRRGVEAYAKGKGITIEKAEQQLQRALRTPTATEKWLRPDATDALAPSVALDAPAGGRTFEEAILERNARRGET